MNLVVEETLLAWVGKGSEVSFTLTCNDNDGRTGLFGKGWRFRSESPIDQTCEGASLTLCSGRELK